jgi:hypothetical protein
MEIDRLHLGGGAETALMPGELHPGWVVTIDALAVVAIFT